MIRFSLLWLAIFIIFPFVWQRCNLFNLDQLISTLSPNGIILNTCQLNPPLSITETTYIGVCDAFPDSSLPIGLFGWLLWGLFLFQLAYRSSLVDCFGAFADFSLLFGFFGWLLWGLFLFRLAYWAISVDCFGVFADSSLPIVLLWLTVLGLSLISACFLASLVDCFGDFFYFGLPIGLLWRFRWFQLAIWLLWVTALALLLIPACLLASFGWLLWRFRWFQLVSPSLHIESVFAVTYNQQLNPTNSIHPVLSCQRPIPAGALLCKNCWSNSWRCHAT